MNPVIEKIRSLPRQTEASLQDCFDLLRQDCPEYGHVAPEYIEVSEWIRDEARRFRTLAMLDLIRKAYIFEARHVRFESYMIALEWNREPEKRFYLPRRESLKEAVDGIQDLLDDRLDLLTISMPPGSGKSTMEIFLLSMVLGLWPEKPNLSSGHSNILTNSLYTGVLGILRDPEYLWGDIFPGQHEIITNAKEQTIDVDKAHRFSSLTCRPIGGSLTGATRCEGLLTADDLCSGIEEAMNKERLDKLWTAYTNDLKSRKKLGCKELHIATRWSVHDVIGRLEQQYANDPRARFIVLPALDENGESNFDYKYGVGFDTAYFEDMRANLDDVSWRCLFMNQPIEREGLLYHEDDLRRYYALPDGEPDVVLGVVDCADGGGDYVVMPVAYGYGDDWYIEDCVCNNGLPDVTNALLVEKLLAHRVKQCQVESNSSGVRVAADVAAAVKEKGGHTSITTKRTQANKETKIIVNSAWVKEHCLFKDVTQYARNSEYAAMIRWLTSYTVMGKNKHDDVPDALAQLAEYVQGLAGRMVTVARRPF